MIAALADGGLESMRLLLKKGANPNEPAKDGIGTLACAVLSMDRGKVDLLLKAGARIDDGGDLYTTPVAAAVLIGDSQTVRRFLPDFKRFDNKDESDGYELLSGAILTVNEPILEMLLEAGANPNRAKEGDRTALQWAAVLNVGHDRVVRALLKHGGDPSLKWKGKTARELAEGYQNTSVIPALP